MAASGDGGADWGLLVLVDDRADQLVGLVSDFLQTIDIAQQAQLSQRRLGAIKSMGGLLIMAKMKVWDFGPVFWEIDDFVVHDDPLIKSEPGSSPH